MRHKSAASLRRGASALKICLILLACFWHTASARDWVKQQSGTLAWLHGIYFLDAQQGWVVGSLGTVLHTTDGGMTWTPLQQPTTDTIHDVYFFDQQTGWLLCEHETTGEEGGSYLLYTSNGGKEWTRVVPPEAGTERMRRMVFSGRERGWLLGEAGTFYETSDGGDNWKRREPPTRYLLLGGALLNNSTGWLTSAGGTLFSTFDGGATWREGFFFNKPPHKRLTAVTFADVRRGWAVGAEGQIYTTANGGRTWRAQTSGLKEDLLDVKFVNLYDGWAIGDKGVMVLTHDGGFHWEFEDTRTTHRLERAFFTDAAHGWVVGFGGTVLAYGSGRDADTAAKPQLKPRNRR